MGRTMGPPPVHPVHLIQSITQSRLDIPRMYIYIYTTCPCRAPGFQCVGLEYDTGYSLEVIAMTIVHM